MLGLLGEQRDGHALGVEHVVDEQAERLAVGPAQRAQGPPVLTAAAATVRARSIVLSVRCPAAPSAAVSSTAAGCCERRHVEGRRRAFGPTQQYARPSSSATTTPRI